jgi:hypothetical protein
MFALTELDENQTWVDELRCDLKRSSDCLEKERQRVKLADSECQRLRHQIQSTQHNQERSSIAETRDQNLIQRLNSELLAARITKQRLEDDLQTLQIQTK